MTAEEALYRTIESSSEADARRVTELNGVSRDAMENSLRLMEEAIAGAR